LPFASFGLGFSIGLRLASRDDEQVGLGAAGISLVATFMCAIQLVSDPVIEPIWLQYMLLSAVPAIVGVALLVRPHLRHRRDAR
jgi:hypothetical protein